MDWLKPVRGKRRLDEAVQFRVSRMPKGARSYMAAKEATECLAVAESRKREFVAATSCKECPNVCECRNRIRQANSLTTMSFM